MEIESVVESKSEQFLLKACQFGASDIYIQPTRENYNIVYRKYGKLTPVSTIPFELGDRIISYFKFLASLDISEKRKPQSGSFQKSIQNYFYSFRVSTLPSVFHRESLVIRLLLQNSTIPLSSLCYNKKSAETLQQLVTHQQGLLIISGATGTGKTTSLYSLVNYCSETLGRHVISLEDPVEKSFSHFLQIQVNEKAGITYAAGLKAILRHSPDVIMIGEIRDEETAKIAIAAALTGHLVLSTLHAKDTVNCIFRLIDLGISIEQLRQAIVGIVSQCLIQIGQDKQSALFEILSDQNLEKAFYEIINGREYHLPLNETLRYQRENLEVNGLVPTTV